MNRLRQQYTEQLVPQLQKQLQLDNVMAVPRIQKVVLNMGVSDQPQNPRARMALIDNIVEQFKTITGQQPQVTKARKSIAGFKLREGEPLGLMVTLRGDRMWTFLDKLIAIALPRVKDFQGTSRTAFDGNGNYSLGIEEQIIFPEINYDAIGQIRGLQVSIVTSAETDAQAFALLESIGMPFAKEETR